MNRRRLLHGAWLLPFATLFVFSGSHADAPPGHYSIGAETVTDNFTRLTWQRTASVAMVNSDAIQVCEQLTLGGSNDWRLPSIKELQTIVDETRTNPAIDVTAFPGTPSEPFWSASTAVNSGTVIATVDFSGGNTTGANFTMGMARTRCVR